MGDHFGLLGVALIVVVGAFNIYRGRVRRRSLRRRDDGVYVWIDWRGRECCSLQDPTEPGGDWDSGGDGDGGD